jgi:ketosteroid isomerase-like protein
VALAGRGAERDTARAMSEENVEIVRRVYDVWNSGDMEAFILLLDPEVVWRPAIADLGRTEYQGHEGFREWVEEMEATLGHFLVEPDDFAQGRTHVVVSCRVVGVGSRSGAQVAQVFSHHWTLRAGRIVRFQSFLKRAEALEAAGLSE